MIKTSFLIACVTNITTKTPDTGVGVTRQAFATCMYLSIDLKGKARAQQSKLL